MTYGDRRGHGTRQKRAASSEGQTSRRRRRMTDAQARARVWTLCLYALVGGYVALAVLLTVAVLRVVRPRLDGHR